MYNSFAYIHLYTYMYIVILNINVDLHSYCIVLPPEITVHPVTQDVFLLQDAVFNCSATGYNVSYHWVFESISNRSKVLSISTNILILPTVKSFDDGAYTCVASNVGGNVRSHVAHLTIIGKFYHTYSEELTSTAK